jgi:hypothetical protein
MGDEGRVLDDPWLEYQAAGRSRSGNSRQARVTCHRLPVLRHRFREDLFFHEDFVYLCDEFFTLGKMSSRS